MPQPPRQEQQPISAMDFLRGTPGQFRAHKQLPVEPEPVRTGRIPKRTPEIGVRRYVGFVDADNPSARSHTCS